MIFSSTECIDLVFETASEERAKLQQLQLL